MSIIAIILVIFVFILYFKGLDNKFPLLELILLIAALQWLLAPIIAYRTEAEHYKYYMYVSEKEYMSLAVPGYIAFLINYFIIKNKIHISKFNKKIINVIKDIPLRHIYWLIIIGFISPVLYRFLPKSLHFILYLFSNFKYIGALYLIFSSSRNTKWLIIIMIFTFIQSITSGMFHDLILWSALMFSFLCYYFKLNFIHKIVTIITGFIFIILLQSIKTEFREYIHTDKPKKIKLFYNMLFEKAISYEEFNDEKVIDELNVRLNQGWIISALMYNVPGLEPFAKGETIKTAIISSIIPRFIIPDKKKAGGVENFTRFTGLELRASMGISILGEGYVNFGKKGAILFMLIWGCFLTIIIRWFSNFSKKNPTFILWLPLIFLQVLKAETELVVVLNHIVKATVLVFVFLWFTRKFLGWNL